MPVFKVTVTRETTDELEVFIEAPDWEDIEHHCPGDIIYEGADSMHELKDWDVVENDIRISASVVPRDDHPEFVLKKDDMGYEMNLAPPPPKPPKVDPRQLPMFPEKETQ